MQLIRRFESTARCNARSGGRGAVVTIGTFDGLHVGHQGLIARAVQCAREADLVARVLSFEPMPREYFAPADPPARLTNFRERWRLLEQLGIEQFWLLRFGPALRVLSPGAFLQRLAADGVRAVIVGHDFRFGQHGLATAEWCQAQGAAFGLAVEVIEPVLVDGERVSSGMVRRALAARDLPRATRLLGRPYTMRGRVKRGQQLGRTLGFPTANLALRRRRSPLAGIYAVRVHGAGLSGWPAVASLGTRPTVGGSGYLLEVHLFDFDADLYGRELEVEFVAHLREEARFAALDALVEQMHRDARAARALLA